MNVEEEIDFVVKVITHPAGYDLDLFGSMCVRPTDQGVWCVSWEENVEIEDCKFKVEEIEKCFPTAREAAEFFVKKRIQDEIGIDFEKC